MIGEISEDEIRQGRPMLRAVVVGVNSGVPGPGFYTWANQLGLLHDETDVGKLRFWETQKEAVYATWRREPYPKPKKASEEGA